MRITLTPVSNIQRQTTAHNFRIIKANAAVLGVMSAIVASCSTIRGGNFVFDESTDTIERFQDYKNKRNLLGKDAFYDAANLKIETLSPSDVDKRIIPTENKYCLEFFEREGQEIKPNIFSKDYLNSINLDKWIDENHDRLIGSCIFTKKPQNIISRLIARCTTGSSFKNEFVPSHAVTIFEKDGEIKILNIISPKAVVESLKEYLEKFEGNYIIYLRDYKVDTERFSQNAASLEGTKYGFLSAAQSVFKGIEFKSRYHCSEVQMLELQKEGLFKGINANKITPNTLMHLLINERFK